LLLKFETVKVIEYFNFN